METRASFLTCIVRLAHHPTESLGELDFGILVHTAWPFRGLALK